MLPFIERFPAAYCHRLEKWDLFTYCVLPVSEYGARNIFWQPYCASYTISGRRIFLLLKHMGLKLSLITRNRLFFLLKFTFYNFFCYVCTLCFLLAHISCKNIQHPHNPQRLVTHFTSIQQEQGHTFTEIT